MPTNVQCPHCGQHLEAAESIEQLAGEAIECPVCRRTFLIENLGQAASRNNGTRTAKTEQRQRVGSNPGQTSVAHTPASPRRSCCAGRWLAEGHKQRKLLALGVLLFLVFGFAITVVFWLNFSRVKVQAVESKPVPNPVANAIELVENSVQLRLEKGDEKNPSLASYLLKWETDEFTKHKEMKESPVTFMATFKGLAHKPSLIDESLSESFGKPFEETFLVFDEPCRIIGSKYIFETKTLLMVVRSDNRFNTSAMSFKDFEEGGVIVDIVLVVPMNPERAQTICQRQREGLLSVFLVFQVEDYTAEKGSMGSRSQFEYFRFEVTPRILSISFE